MKTLLISLLSMLLLACGSQNGKERNINQESEVNHFIETIKQSGKDVKQEKLKITEDRNSMVDSIGNCKKCNIEYVVEVEKEMQNLTEKKVFLFLCTFSPLCANNVEFEEYSNEILFKLLETNASLVLGILNERKDDIHVDVIMNELASPISDLANIETIRKNINSIEDIDSNIKEKVLQTLPKTN